MKLAIAWIGKTKDPAIDQLTQKYLQRLSFYAAVEGMEVKDESRLLKFAKAESRRTLIVLDGKGKEFSSEQLATFLVSHQEKGSGSLLFAVGPADGFGEQILKAADFKISLGKMTLAHELARIVVLEQLYRAFTILKKHPYHLGH